MATVKLKKIALYPHKGETQNFQPSDIDSFIEDIRSGRWEDQVLRVRTADTPEKKDRAKGRLPCATLSGIFNGREDKGIVSHSAYIAIDIDLSGQTETTLSAPAMRDLIGKDDYVYAAFLSCSAKGVCALVKVNPKAHRESYEWMSAHFHKEYRIHTDPSCKNLARIRYVSYDPDIRTNQTALPCPAEPLPKKDQAPLRKYYFVQTDFDHIIEQITAKEVDITPTYREWILIGWSLISHFPEDLAREYFHAVSQFNGGYEYTEADNKFTALLKSNRDETPIDYFYLQVERNGIEAYGKATHDFIMLQAVADPDTRDPEIDPALLQQQLDEAPLVTKVKYYLKAKHDKYEKNEFTGELNADDEPIREEDYNSLYIECKERIDEKVTWDLIYKTLNSNFVRSVHPFKEFIKHCQETPPEPATGNIDKIIKALTVDTDHAELFIKKWLVAMVASAFGKNSDLVLVFCGPQGTGKTEWFKRILPDELSRYRASLNWDSGRDEVIRMSRNLIMLDDEMGGKSNKEEKQIKKVTSIDKEAARGAYKHTDEYYKRAAIFCGTTNDEWILNDPTGNRRFLPIYIVKMDHEMYNSVDKRALFYELYNLYMSGFSTILSAEEKILLNDISTRFQKPQAPDELVAKHYALPETAPEKYPRRKMTATDILIELKMRAPGIPLDVNKVGSALQRAGFKRKKHYTGKWFYTIAENPSSESDFDEPIDDIL